jgi:hypothetical protein
MKAGFYDRWASTSEVYDNGDEMTAPFAVSASTPVCSDV